MRGEQKAGQIPLEPFLSWINMQVANYDGIKNLAARCDIAHSTIHKLINDEGRVWVSFNIIDTMFCAAGDGLLTWQSNEEWNRIYYEADLSDSWKMTTLKDAESRMQCARPGCTVRFTPKVPWQRYCGPTCNHAGWRERKREKEGREKRYGTRYGECPNGHDRSPENTYTHPTTGRVSCRVCSREGMKAKYHADDLDRQRKIQRERKRRAENREAINARRRELYRQKKVAA